MEPNGTPIARLPARDPAAIDRILAVLLTGGALVDAGALSEHGQPALAIVSCIALTGTVAWSRRRPISAALVTVTALVVFELASRNVGTGLFEDAAIIWVFYGLGRRGRGQDRVLVSAAELCGWLGACVAVGYTPGGALDNTGGALASTSFWALSGILPYALGRTLAARSALTRELEQAATRLQDEQDVRAQLAAAAERAKMARELHDVVAHCVSVMVVQTAGARRVAQSDLDAARDALKVVERAGREALVELRRIVGVLHRGEDDISGGVTPGLAHLDALLDRARAAGLPVGLEIEGPRDALPAGLDLVVYRVVQEALTNAIKHAGRAHARVLLAFGAGELELRVSDNGRGPGSGPGDGSGHGLVGMSERVRLYGGELRTGAGPTGGFEVRARIPLDGSERAPRGLRGSSPGERGPDVAASDRITLRWLDPLLALGFLVTLELVALTSDAHGQARFRDMVALAAMALACVWRRRRPLWFVIVVVTLAFALSGPVAPRSSIVAAIYVGLVPAYAVAAWEDRRNAWLGLAILVSASAVGQMLLHHVGVGNYAGALFTICVAWAAGRAIRARRVAAAALERATMRLAVERDDRAELAVAGERSRIARELHAVIAHSVAAMVIQTEAARGLLDADPATADTALAAIQSTGRQALSEMRKILGVLRHQDDAGELVPQPGVDQIYRLIQRARDQGQPVELSVDGEPGALSAGVDLGIYRIVEEALNSVGRQPTTAIGVRLHFGENDVELQVTGRCPDARTWPTGAMRERVTLCDGELHTAPHGATGGWHLIARMPRGLQGALA